MPEIYTGRLTNAGQNLVASLLTGERIIYDSVVFASDSLTLDDIPALTGLSNIEMPGGFHGFMVEDNKAIISCGIEMAGVELDFNLTALGVYAKTQSNSTPILYQVYLFTPPLSIPTMDLRLDFLLQETVLNAGQVDVNFSGNAYCPMSHYSDLYKHALLQTNNSSTEAFTASILSDLPEGAVFMFVPQANLVAGATLTVAGDTKPIKVLMENGTVIDSGLPKDTIYVIRKRGGFFETTIQNRIAEVDGVAHIFTQNGWQTLRKAGEYLQHFGREALAGTLVCDGSFVEMSEYPELFSVIGVLPDTNAPQGQFALPNMIDRYAVGGSSANVGRRLGANEIVLNSKNLPTFTFVVPNHAHEVNIPAGTYSKPLRTSLSPSEINIPVDLKSATSVVGQTTTFRSNYFIHKYSNNLNVFKFKGNQTGLEPPGDYKANTENPIQVITASGGAIISLRNPATDIADLNDLSKYEIAILPPNAAEKYTTSSVSGGTAQITGEAEKLDNCPASLTVLPLIFTGKVLI